MIRSENIEVVVVLKAEAPLASRPYIIATPINEQPGKIALSPRTRILLLNTKYYSNIPPRGMSYNLMRWYE